MVANSAARAARSAEVVLTSLPSEAALDATVAALVSDGAVQQRDLILVELSTLGGPCKSQAHDALAAVGIHMLTAPSAAPAPRRLTQISCFTPVGDAAVPDVAWAS